MTYVDMGWPQGLVLISLNALISGQGWWARRYIISLLMFFHGGRMTFGGAMVFGRMTKFTYIFSEDLARYKYAKINWSSKHGMPQSMWPFKAQ